MTDTTRLTKLLISEVSGVDDPANQLPGWMVMKARGADASPWESCVEACDELRRELDNDVTFERVIKAFATEGEYVFLGRESVSVLTLVPEKPSFRIPAGVEVVKAKAHDLRHPTDGKYVPAKMGIWSLL